mgnify:CR=1 FL=1
MSHLVLVGGGHAHLTTLKRLEAFSRHGHTVTCVSPDRYHYYSGMGPGLLGQTYSPLQVRFDLQEMVAGGGTFLHDRVVGLQPAEKALLLASGQSLTYDVASFNVGSEVVVPSGFEIDELLVPVKPIVNLETALQRLMAIPKGQKLRLLVAGGGPAGTEVAGNLRGLLDRTGRRGEIIQVAGHRLLANFPDRMRALVLKQFARRQIDVREDVHLTGYADGRALLEDGANLAVDGVFLASGVRPPSFFQQAGLSVGEDGGLLVNRELQSVDAPELFAGGDCLCFAERPLAKVGVYAVRQNPVLFENLMAALSEKPLQPFTPQRHYLLILNLGDGQGVLHWRGHVLAGRWVCRLKDRIDRQFMRKFQ